MNDQQQYFEQPFGTTSTPAERCCPSECLSADLHIFQPEVDPSGAQEWADGFADEVNLTVTALAMLSEGSLSHRRCFLQTQFQWHNPKKRKMADLKNIQKT